MTKILNNKTIVDVFKETLDIAVKFTDRLDVFGKDDIISVFPWGKIFLGIINVLKKLTDFDEGFQKIFFTAYLKAFLEALQENNLDLDIERKEIKILKDISPHKASEFQIDTSLFYKNEIVHFYDDMFLSLMRRCEVNKKDRIRIKNHIHEVLQVYFYYFLEKNQIIFDRFKKLNDSLSHEANRLKIKKDRYRKKLQNYYHEVVLNDEKGMRLKDIYVKSGVKIHHHCLDNPEDFHKFDQYNYIELSTYIYECDAYEVSLYQTAPPDVERPDDPVKRDIDIHKLINDMLTDNCDYIEYFNASDYRVIFILGHPGQGKSSFCKRLLHDICSGNEPIAKPVYFFKLRDLKDVKKFKSRPFLTIKQSISEELDTNEQALDLDNAVLILDGLDEIFLGLDLKISEIDKVCEKLMMEVKDSQVKIVITSRHGPMTPDSLAPWDALILHLREFSLDDQKEWLGKYKRIHPECLLQHDDLERYNDEKMKLEHIRELINQPILLHMIAISGIVVDEKTNRAKVYDELFSKLIDRDWDEAKQIKSIRKIKKEDLRNFIQDIAFEIFKSGKLFIPKEKIRNHSSTKKLLDTLSNEQLDDHLKAVMIAFYFSEVRSKDAIEFLHNSLQEFMVAEFIWRRIQVDFLETKSRSGEYIIDDSKQALELIFKIFSSQGLTQEITQYLIQIINNDADTSRKKELSQRLSKFLPQFISRDFTGQYDSTNESFPIDMALNTFYGFWTILSHLEKGKNYINDEIRKRFVYLIQYLEKNESRFINLSGQNLSEVSLMKINLFKSNLSEADLSGADLSRANLSNANLSKANLSKTKLIGIELNGSNLGEANFRDADFKEASVSDTNLRGANLSSLDLRGIDFSGSDLTEADLSSADLGEANLRHSKLLKTNLNGSNLSEANLCWAELSESDLSGAKLEGADLFGAKLVGIDLKGIDLTGINLRKANLSDANLSGTDLRKSDLSDANLSGTDLRKSDLSDANLSGTDLRNADLRYVDSILVNQCLNVKTLYNTILNSEFEQELRKIKPELFDEPQDPPYDYHSEEPPF